MSSDKSKEDVQVALLGAARAAHVLFVTAPIKHAAPEGHIHLWH